MRHHKKQNYKKLFKKISKTIIGLFHKRKIKRHHIKKENKYLSFIRKFFKKPNKLKRGKIFIGLSISFLVIITLISFLITNKSIETNKSAQNITYDFMHGSATGRDFLFEGETGHDSNLTIEDNESGSNNILYTGSMNTNNSGNTIKSGNTMINSGKTEKDATPQDLIDNNTGIINSGNLINTGIIKTTNTIESGNIIILPIEISKYLIRKLKAQIKQQQLLSEKTKEDCITPRKTTVKHGDFVLAYTQRTDINNLCNVEKRYCTDGILGGTFTQKECDKNAKYQYQTPEIKSYTQEVQNNLIQPSEAKNNSANFSKDGKINEQNIISTNLEYGKSGTQIVNSKNVGLKYIADTSDCKDPRGNNLKNGLFVTAYKAPLGFIDLECESEFRYCHDGKLGGSFSYKECKYKDITYNDYLVGNTNTDKSTTLDLMENIDPTDKTKSENIRSKIQSLFR